MLKELFHRIVGNRRHQEQPVPQDRRGRKVAMKEADEMLHSAIKDLEKTVRINRDQLFK